MSCPRHDTAARSGSPAPPWGRSGDAQGSSGLPFSLREIGGGATVPLLYRGSVPDLFKLGRHVSWLRSTAGLTHQLLADIVGSVRETVSLAPAELVHEGFVERHQRKLVVRIAPAELSPIQSW